VGRTRVRDWELLLARIRVFGFTVLDDGRDTIVVERDGRTCHVDLVNTVRIGAKDPRDLWLLKQAIEDSWQWAALETYFLRRYVDGEIFPVELRLGFHSEKNPTLFLDHDPLGDNERTTILSSEHLKDMLPLLAAPNSIGYHRARERIIARFEKLRPKTWDEIGIGDGTTIAEYERYQITADDVAHARAGGREAMDEIISAYGIPQIEWADVQPDSDHADDH
jgi:hypothetical protein